MLAGLRQGHGPPVVMLHGIGLSWHTWEPLFPHLGDVELHAVDLPGFGASPPLAGEVTVARLLDALERHLDELELDTAHVVGNSLGGLLAIGLGARGRARSITAISPGGAAEGWEHGLAMRAIRLQRIVAERAAPVLLPAMANPAVRFLALRTGTAARPDRMSPAHARTILSGFASAPGLEPTRQAMSGPGARVSDYLDDVAVPVTVAWGTGDALLFPRQGQRLAARYPKVRLVRLPGMGHVPMTDDPATVAAVIRSTVADAGA